jgi:8-oxo-dGTP pyrophosphatase MutT (NUDIX family)
MGLMLELTRENIINSLKSFDIRAGKHYRDYFPIEKSQSFRASAVMIPLLQENSEWHVLFTRRSDQLVEHRGQVAFPGGAMEKDDLNLKMTALREMQEEIGIKPEDVVVLGNIGDMPVVTGYNVRVFVGEIPWPYDLQINQDEVDSVFLVPLAWLSDPDHYSVQYREFAGKEIPVVYYDLYKGQQIWGASADMTLAIISAIGY